MLYTPDGKKIERRASLPPERNIHFKDGRILRYRGPFAPLPDSGVWMGGDGLNVIASLDDTQHGRLLHVSTARADRDPSWADIMEVRYSFFSDEIDTMMVLPKLADYVNVHTHCFHIWQTPTEWGVS